MKEIGLVLAGALPTLIIAIIGYIQMRTGDRRKSSHLFASELRTRQMDIAEILSAVLTRIIGRFALVCPKTKTQLGNQILSDDTVIQNMIDSFREDYDVLLNLYANEVMLLSPSNIVNSVSILIAQIGSFFDNPTKETLAECEDPTFKVLNTLRSLLGVDELSKSLKIVYTVR